MKCIDSRIAKWHERTKNAAPGNASQYNVGRLTFPDHFSDRASGYARSRPTYPEGLVGYLAASAPRTTLAYEVGCGSGQLTRLLATCFENVIATDPSAAQLAHAPPIARVWYHCATAEACALRDGVVDLMVAAQAAHWFDVGRFYAEARRISAPNGVIALISYGVTTVSPEIDAVIRHFHTRVLEHYWPPERRHVDAGYTTLPFPFEPLDPPALEMSCVWTLADMLAYVDTWSAVRALETAEGRARTEAFRRELTDVWLEPDTPRTVRWPLAIKAGRVGRAAHD